MAAVRKRRSGKDAAVEVQQVHEQPAAVSKSQVQQPADLLASGIHTGNMVSWIRSQPLWIVLAVASGACAAINGVFAKLTTTALTSTLASSISHALGYDTDNTYVEVALRSVFFGLNVVFNIIMWTLFTAALTRSNSTTRVSIVNVSSNFFITAVLGAMIFGEKLPLGWWFGAALLASGNIVIGRREEVENPSSKSPTRAEEEEHDDISESQPLVDIVDEEEDK